MLALIKRGLYLRTLTITNQAKIYFDQLFARGNVFVNCDFIRKYKSASRKDIDELLLSKLPDLLGSKNKINRIRYLINILSVKEKSMKNIGNNRVLINNVEVLKTSCF